MQQLVIIALLAVILPHFSFAQNQDLKIQVRELVTRESTDLLNLYKHLHAHPELSLHELQTSARMASELRKSGYEVTTAVGGHGVVALLRNGNGPTVMVRADMDALPVKEQTGLSYASTVTTKDEDGQDVPVMHACGHDMHMACLIGTARALKSLTNFWQGTLVLIAQPAEERGGGARRMLRDGLFERFPRPDYCLALHLSPEIPAGSLAFIEGHALANVDMVDITVRGVGGHGAYPHQTKDPIVLAAEIVLALQTIVSREITPGEAAVVTVGAIHGGTKHNIIPDEVRLQLTLRSYTDKVRQQTLKSLERIARGQAIAAGIPEDRMPIVRSEGHTPATYNQPKLALRLAGVWRSWLGQEQVIQGKPVMGGEDFSEYGRTAEKVPICMFWLGSVDPESFKAKAETKSSLPSLHSSIFAPSPELTLQTGVTAMTASVLDLLSNKLASVP